MSSFNRIDEQDLGDVFVQPLTNILQMVSRKQYSISSQMIGTASKTVICLTPVVQKSLEIADSPTCKNGIPAMIVIVGIGVLVEVVAVNHTKAVFAETTTAPPKNTSLVGSSSKAI